MSAAALHRELYKCDLGRVFRYLPRAAHHFRLNILGLSDTAYIQYSNAHMLHRPMSKMRHCK